MSDHFDKDDLQLGGIEPFKSARPLSSRELAEAMERASIASEVRMPIDDFARWAMTIKARDARIQSLTDLIKEVLHECRAATWYDIDLDALESAVSEESK